MIVEIIVYLFIAIFIGISQSAGIGGGPILNISLIVGLGYDARYSMNVTYIFLMGGALASIWKNKTKKNANGHPVIDYNLVLLTLPEAISGSLFGTILNHFINDLIITILFSILLSYLTYNSYEKLKQLKNNETVQIKVTSSLRQVQINSSTTYDQSGSYTAENSLRLKQIQDLQKSLFPIKKIFIALQIIVLTILIILCKGGQSFDSILGLERCGYVNMSFIIIHFLMSYFYTKVVANQQSKLDMEKQSLGYVFQNPSDKMSFHKMRWCMLYGFIAGLFGGALGLGGAIILVPVWLNKGIDKTVAISSSPPIIFASSFISFFIGLVESKYHSFLQVLFCFLLAYIGSYIIKCTYFQNQNRNHYLHQLKISFKVNSYIILIIIMVLSLGTLIPFQINKFITNPQDFISFGVLC